MKSNFPKQQYRLEGTNDSTDKDVLITSGEQNFFNTTFKYVLPLGERVDNPERLYTLMDGFVMGREDYGNGTPLLRDKPL